MTYSIRRDYVHNHMSRLNPKLRVIGIYLSAVLSTSVAAQTPISLNVEIPQMFARICPTLEEAKKEANLAWHLGKEFLKDGTLDTLRNEKCQAIFVAITPLREESSIRPFATWVFAYDPNGPEQIDAPSLGANKRIKAIVRQERVRYYFANFVTLSGQRFSGWAEIPDRPYILSYIDEQKNKAVRK